LFQSYGANGSGNAPPPPPPGDAPPPPVSNLPSAYASSNLATAPERSTAASTS
jgi:hypothetical protein